MTKKKQIRRRDLLAATVAVAGFPAIIPARAFGSNDRVTMASIGIGGQGSGHLRSLTQMPEVRVLATCDVREDRRDSAKQVVDSAYGDTACKTYKDFREVLARPDIDAILLAVPDHWHALIGIEAARRGKHMYYEKPMGLTFADARAMRDAVRRYGVTFQFGTQQRSMRDYRFTTELVRNGHIGQLQTMVIGSAQYQPVPTQPEQPVPAGLDYDLWLGPARWQPYTELRCSRNFTLIYDYSIGCISGAWGVHDVDIAQWANNADTTGPLTAEGTGWVPSEGIYDTYHTFEIEHRYANGVKLLHLDIGTAKKRYPQFQFGNMAMLFIGTEGWIYVSRQGMRTHPESLMRTVIGPDQQKVIVSDDHRRNFLQAMRTGEKPVSDIEAAVRADMVCQQADIALRLGRKITWDPAKEAFVDDEAANRMLSRPMRSPWHL